ncbi:hypothetical protein [Streptomyces luteogriseus]|uniref:hypothetical protein n=1 Tax=Streptomyces luteogriseus TaxID=68233 RepID=UPI002628EAE9|nr:hypothetical protein [Streptomyces luteogriseus]WTJ28632.1 hypothetical protein OID52_16950 [Streptomyces luteogriseus]
MSDEDHDLGPWEFIGRRGGDTATLVGGSVIADVPEARRAAEEARRELRFDFLDDRAVLELLRRRHRDEEDMFNAGFVHGVPLALVGLGAVLYWAGVAQYWETAAPRNAYLAVAITVVVTQFFFFVRSAMSHWGDPVRQNLRARAARYRKIAHIARRGGADIPAHYPHYGPYPFAATFRPEVDDREQSDSKGTDDHGHR